MSVNFDYFKAFSRNIGWITREEQIVLRNKRIAIAGMGGVGGSHLLTLTRLGIGKFNLSDFDIFEIANFNRQAGANIQTIGKSKLDVLKQMALDINPELDIRLFNTGVQDDTIDDFLQDVDLYIDGLDFFALSARKNVFRKCAELGIPAVTAAPLGMGAALLNFLPGQMTFEQYFQLEGNSEEEQFLRFFVGLAPKMVQQKYLADPAAIDLAAHKGPSTPMGCELCAGVAATQALKILLHRGKVLAAPHGLQFDAFANKVAHSWRPLGNSNPVNQLLLTLARKNITRSKLVRRNKEETVMENGSVIEKILDHARWAPSGDNTQPWRFEIISDNHVAVHTFDTRDHVVYDLQGHASQISIGALLETLSIAATEYNLHAEIKQRTNTPTDKLVFDIHFREDKTITPDPLIPYIRTRTVQRRPMRTRGLTLKEKEALANCLPKGFSLLLLEGFSNRLKMAKLMFLNDKLRLSIKEAYHVHSSIIEWKARYSVDKVPEQAVGVDYMTARIMQWTMQSWERVQFMNKYMAGTLAPRIQLAFVPALACAAHFVLLRDEEPHEIQDYVASGRALQRFWLTATQVGLHIQPEYTPLVFQEFVRDKVEFSEAPFANALALEITERLVSILGNDAKRAVYMGRIGESNTPSSRSTRLSLDSLRKT